MTSRIFSTSNQRTVEASMSIPQHIRRVVGDSQGVFERAKEEVEKDGAQTCEGGGFKFSKGRAMLT